MKNWTISRKITGLALASLFFTALAALVGLVCLERLHDSGLADIKNQKLLRLNLEADMAHDAIRADVLRAMAAGWDAMEVQSLSSTQGDTIGTKLKVQLEQSKQLEAEIRREFKHHAKEMYLGVDAIAGSNVTSDLKTLASDARKQMDTYLGIGSQVVDQAFTDPASQRGEMPKLEQAFKALELSLGKLSDQVTQLAQQSEIERNKTARLGRAAIASALVLGVFVVALLSWALRRALTRPLSAAAKVAAAVSAGDLTTSVEVHSRDELGQMQSALKHMVVNLGDIAQRVRRGSEEISRVTAEVASGNFTLSERTEEQASTLEETAASAEELSAAVKQNADTARSGGEVATAAREAAVESGHSVDKVVDAMGQIRQSSRRIDEITAVIDGIAFQTNILALNAAVEAARAGEQGRGFAVVASEVRSLSQRAATAAKEIKGLISDASQQVERGSKLAADAGGKMKDTVERISNVADRMHDIALASEEQSRGIEQINQAITQLETVTQQNAALVEETAAASESLAFQAKELVMSVSVFKLKREEPSASTPSSFQQSTAPSVEFKPAMPVTDKRKNGAVKSPAREDEDANAWTEF